MGKSKRNTTKSRKVKPGRAGGLPSSSDEDTDKKMSGGEGKLSESMDEDEQFMEVSDSVMALPGNNLVATTTTVAASSVTAAALTAGNPVHIGAATGRPVRKTFHRFDLKVIAEARADSALAFFSVAKTVFTEIINFDPDAILIPWDEPTPTQTHISKANNLPATKTEIEKFFDRYFARDNQRNTHYVSIYLGINKEPKKLTEWMSAWARSTEHGFYDRQIQAPRTTVIGWFFMSTQQMEVELWRKKIITKIGGHPVGLRWRPIATNKSGKIMDWRLVTRAVHVEVVLDDKVAVEKIMKLFSSTAKSFPGNLTVRIVPMLADCIDPESEKFSVRMRKRQKKFCGLLKFAKLQGCLAFDDKIIGNQSVREILMTLRSKEAPNRRVFISVDRAFNDPTLLVATYVPSQKLQAKGIMGGLVRYLREEYSESEMEVEICFTPAAVEESRKQSWDTVRQCASNSADAHLKALMDVDDEFDADALDDDSDMDGSLDTMGSSVATNFTVSSTNSRKRLLLSSAAMASGRADRG